MTALQSVPIARGRLSTEKGESSTYMRKCTNETAQQRAPRPRAAKGASVLVGYRASDPARATVLKERSALLIADSVTIQGDAPQAGSSRHIGNELLRRMRRGLLSRIEHAPKAQLAHGLEASKQIQRFFQSLR